MTVKGASVINPGIHNKGTLVIEGGTFTFDPTQYVDHTTHTVTPNTDGTYTVTAK